MSAIPRSIQEQADRVAAEIEREQMKGKGFGGKDKDGFLTKGKGKGKAKDAKCKESDGKGKGKPNGGKPADPPDQSGFDDWCKNRRTVAKAAGGQVRA